MPKKKKLQLKALKVQSFVTELGDDADKVKGGVTPNTGCFIGTCYDCSVGVCPTDQLSCNGTCDQSCNGTCTCGGSCGGTCETCYTCYTDCNCPPVVTIPSCPQIVCTA
jgi:hypothetical protein